MMDDRPTVICDALATLPEVVPPAHLHRQIVTALDLEAARGKQRPTWRQRITRHPKLVGYGLGLAVATLLFGSLSVTVWTPLQRLMATPDYAIVYVPHPQPHRFVGGLTTTATLPHLTSGNGFDTLPAGLATRPEGMLVIAEISPSGEARCVDVVEPYADASLVAAVDHALQRMTFHPATQANGQPVAARIAFYLEQVAIRG
ncbi:MAG: hypothetical protein SNJ67_04265 [Chloracidobacterium sp.]|uniref:TonB C-terminal domain-containing protein n=1 Tax=Chloracidobacterium validum TaxID=2821543 RepID=A0ABX8B933_9BACT|nr:hypothetical protein [Chloracidobacterium validum]QUW02189.1 hypothetical protein J8C06_07400 [Chloracidobacterium validum]